MFLRLGISACMLLRNERLLKDFGQRVVVVGMLLRGLSHEIFTGCFWLEWIYLGLNGNRFMFLSFKEIPSILDS